MKIGEALSENCIRLELSANNREDAIQILVNELVKTNTFDNESVVYKAVLERERIMTTGVGNGIAIPHCKHESCKEFKIALGVLKQGVDFSAIDSQPVNIVFLLIGPNSTAGNHIKLLSRISRLMNNIDIREKLVSLKSSEEVYQFLLEKEKMI